LERTVGTLKRSWRAAVVNLSHDYDVEWITPKSLEDAHSDDFAVSRLGTIAAGIVDLPLEEPFILVSMYGSWESTHPMIEGSSIYADTSVHRIISDISTFIRNKDGHRIIAAGDLNILYGYGERGREYREYRYSTVFDRMNSLGLDFVGPQAPDGGKQAYPWPKELPKDSKNVSYILYNPPISRNCNTSVRLCICF